MTPLAKLCVTFAVLIAMAGSGFAHRAPAAEFDDSMLAYVAAGGALNDLCGDANFDDGHGNNCDACRLVDTAALPVKVTDATMQTHGPSQQHLLRPVTAPVAQVANPSCPVRAPPVV